MLKTKNKKINCNEHQCSNRALSIYSQNRLELSPRQFILPGGFIKVGGQFYEVWTMESPLAQNFAYQLEIFSNELEIWDEDSLKELSFKKKNKKSKKSNNNDVLCQLCGSKNKLDASKCDYCESPIL